VAVFNNSAMISGLYNGLNEEVKDAIAFIATRPKSFNEYTQMVISVDNCLFEQQHEKQCWSTSGYLHFAPTKEAIAPKPKPTIMVEDPMDINVSRQIGATDSDRAAERAQRQ
jgi:hypothetical protein